MSVVVISEGTTLSYEGWRKRFGFMASEIQYILDNGLLKRTEEDSLTLSFVGLIILDDRVVYSPPKFSKSVVLPLGKTIEILHRYFSRNINRKPFEDQFRSPDFGNAEVLREYDALLSLNDWFLAHGLYRFEQSVTAETGRPHWSKTLAKGGALFTPEGVIYDRVVAVRREGATNDITALQLGVLQQLGDRYGLQLPNSVVNSGVLWNTEFKSWPLPSAIASYYSRRLAQEKRKVFRTETLRLLSTLGALLEEPLASSDRSPRIFGTTAFYSVWEDACRVAFCGELDNTAHFSLGQPTWFVPSGKEGIKAFEHVQRPDFIVKQGGYLFILDAKYYYPFPQSRPGAPDIIKQIYYSESLSDDSSDLISVFLLPSHDTGEFEFKGFATIENAPRKFGFVEAWCVNPRDVFEAYCAPSNKKSTALVNSLISGRGQVLEYMVKTPSSIGSKGG